MGPPKKTIADFDLTYVGTGVAGSICFSLASILEGEYNDWRKCRMSLPVLMSHFNFWGANAFLVGYAVDTNEYADDTGERSGFKVIGVDCTFFIGSLGFLLAACMDLVMWQQERYGLGFAKKLQNYSEVKADVKHLLLIALTIINICLAWIRLAF